MRTLQFVNIYLLSSLSRSRRLHSSGAGSRRRYRRTVTPSPPWSGCAANCRLIRSLHQLADFPSPPPIISSATPCKKYRSNISRSGCPSFDTYPRTSSDTAPDDLPDLPREPDRPPRRHLLSSSRSRLICCSTSAPYLYMISYPLFFTGCPDDLTAYPVPLLLIYLYPVIKTAAPFCFYNSISPLLYSYRLPLDNTPKRCYNIF